MPAEANKKAKKGSQTLVDLLGKGTTSKKATKKDFKMFQVRFSLGFLQETLKADYKKKTVLKLLFKLLQINQVLFRNT